MSVEVDAALEHDIKVLSVVVAHGLEGFESRGDMPLALPIPDDPDQVEGLGVWYRLSVCACDCENLLWLQDEGPVREESVTSKSTDDLHEKDMFDKDLLEKVRNSKKWGIREGWWSEEL